ncbi:MAG TPA: inositol monophosphatase family protein [Bacteroidales bacterium]|nr:inositol monophosphatase family protein [Bacteroidales bacterium]
MDYKALCQASVEIAVEAGDFIFSRLNSISPREVETKGRHNFVTEVDKEAEILIIGKLKTLVEGAGFIAEEGTSSLRGEKYNWVIDPLDGTTNFIHGAPPVAVSIALVENDIPVTGVVYEIWMKEAFYAWKDSAAYLNGKEIRVSATSGVKDALIATGFPYHNYDRLEGFMKSMDYFFGNTHGVRRLGSAATDLAYVACGRFEGFYEYNLSPWDVAAGALIVTRAGGRVSDFNGGDGFLFGKEIVASNKKVFDEFLHDVARFMNPG